MRALSVAFVVLLATAACGVDSSPQPAGVLPATGPVVTPGSDAGVVDPCNGSCATNEVCVGGTCEKNCPPGQSACDRVCLDLTANNTHCGRCHNTCDATEYCNAGSCVRAGCQNGVKDPGELGIDCGGSCATACASGGPPAAVSCKALKAAAPSTPDGVYSIDPDGAGAIAPFQVFCDMTTSGGGWTALPLRFADAAMWNITTTASGCVTVANKTNAGFFDQTQTSESVLPTATTMKFVPPLPVSEVRLVEFNHSPSSNCNSMDFAVGTGTVSSAYEGWYFSDIDATKPLGLAFASSAACKSPYVYTDGSPPQCSRDSNLGDALFLMDQTITYSAPATIFQMVLVQGCLSSVCGPPGERFSINIPPPNDGIWRKGILVR